MTNTLHPVAQAQLDSAQQKVAPDEMIEFARAEASRIEAVQRGLIDCGARSRPDEGQIRRMVVADALAKWIQRERGGARA